MRKIIAAGANTVITIFLFITCRRIDFYSENKKELIKTSKTWFEDYLANETIHEQFKDIEYIWEKAKIFTFRNGYKAVTVPVINKKQNIDYFGKRILYLYPWKNGKGF